MSVTNIQEALHNLRYAEYGTDLKQAIMDCLSTCYNDGTIDLVARQMLAQLATDAPLIAYPVGSVYTTADLDFDPNITFGGTWVVWGAGKEAIGVDSGDTDFNAVEKTGGTKTVTLAKGNLPSHTHTYSKAGTPTGGTALTKDQIPSHTHSGKMGALSVTKTGVMPYSTVMPSYVTPLYTASASGSGTTGSAGSGNTHNHTVSNENSDTGSAGSGAAISKLMPYITCCRWKRTA